MIRSRAMCGAVALATLVPVVAAAQTPRNPFADLFGRAPVTTGEFTSVQLRSTVGAQIGQTLEQDFNDPQAVPEGLAAGADANLIAEYRRSRFQASGLGRYSYQEYRQEPAFGAPAFEVGGRMNYDVTNRVAFLAGGHFTRSPYFRLAWLGPEMFGPSTMPAGDTSAIFMLGNDTVGANAGINVELTKRTTFTVDGFARQTTFNDASVDRFASRGGRGLFRQQLTRSLSLRAGYGREEAAQSITTGGEERFTHELIDVGVDFAKSMSMGRRTTFALATETSVVREDGGPRHFRLNGTLALERRFLRTWITRLGARRATEFMPGFRGPVFTETARLSLDGYFTKRLLLNANGEGGRGHVGVTDTRRFDSYTAATSLTFALTRNFGVFGQYAYGRYQMPADPLALITVPRYARQAVSVGVKTWVSIIDKEKVPRDPR